MFGAVPCTASFHARPFAPMHHGKEMRVHPPANGRHFGLTGASAGAHLDVGRGAVHRLHEREAVLADVAAGREAEAADEAGAQVGDDVAVEVGHDEHVELARVGHELHAYAQRQRAPLGDE